MYNENPSVREQLSLFEWSVDFNYKEFIVIDGEMLKKVEPEKTIKKPLWAWIKIED
jgi:hypothetical protein